jgi:hypothetical protein
MTRPSALLGFAACAAALAAALEACRQGPAPREPVAPAPAIGAYDVIKLCRFSAEAGPVWFSHALHADLDDASGARIPCARCHHEAGGGGGSPPRGCSKCHLTHRHDPDAKVLPT